MVARFRFDERLIAVAEGIRDLFAIFSTIDYDSALYLERSDFAEIYHFITHYYGLWWMVVLVLVLVLVIIFIRVIAST